jgi:ribosomal protein L37AE/L43A
MRRKHRRGFVSVGRRKPEIIDAQFDMSVFDVKWRVMLGYSSIYRLSEFFGVYVQGPFCPICDYELDLKQKPRLFGWLTKEVWHCAQCNHDYDRPSKYLYDEEEIVKKMIEAELSKQEIKQ